MPKMQLSANLIAARIKAVKRTPSRSPLRAPPLRYPGQSVQEEINRIREQFDSELVLLIIAVTVTAMGLLQWVLRTPPLTFFIVTLVIALGAGIYTGPKMLPVIRALKHLRQARDGELAVAECLDLLRDDGCRVLHDVVGDSFNVDHVVIAPQGIYTVETKTFSKPCHFGKRA